MRRWTAAILLMMACDPSASAKSDEAAAEPEVKGPAVAETETVVDRASLAALCIRGTLNTALEGNIGTGVLIDKKDGTKRFGWVAGALEPSAFDKLNAEQAARMLEMHLKTADSLREQFAGVCTSAIEAAGPVVLTFTIEQKAVGEEVKAGYWVVAGNTAKRDIEFLPGAALADAKAKAMAAALEVTGVTALGKGSTIDHGKGSASLCPSEWEQAIP